MKKIEVIIGLIWFITALILGALCSYLWKDFIALSILNIGMSFGFLVSDSEIANMELW